MVQLRRGACLDDNIHLVHVACCRDDGNLAIKFHQQIHYKYKIQVSVKSSQFLSWFLGSCQATQSNLVFHISELNLVFLIFFFNLMYIFNKWWGHYGKTSLFTCNRVLRIFFCFRLSSFKSLWRYGTADLLYLSVWALFTKYLSEYLFLMVWPSGCLGKKLEKFSFLIDILANFSSFFSLLSWRLSYFCHYFN